VAGSAGGRRLRRRVRRATRGGRRPRAGRTLASGARARAARPRPSMAEERTSGAGIHLISGGRFGGRPSSPSAGSASDPRRPVAPSGTDLGERRAGPSRAAPTGHGGGADERRGEPTNGARGAMVGAEASAGGVPAGGGAGVPAAFKAGVLPNGLFFVRQKYFWYRLVFPTDTNECLRHRVKNPVS